MPDSVTDRPAVYVCEPDDDGIDTLRTIIDGEADRILAAMSSWIVGVADRCPRCGDPWNAHHIRGYDTADGAFQMVCVP